MSTVNPIHHRRVRVLHFLPIMIISQQDDMANIIRPALEKVDIILIL